MGGHVNQPQNSCQPDDSIGLAAERAIQPGELIRGKGVSLRLATLEDCGQEYLGWLEDPLVNQYLETRWNKQTLELIRSFVTSCLTSSDSYLFAIVVNKTNKHIGNIKVGPIQRIHSYADVSYFIGDSGMWGYGYGSEAIRLVTQFSFHTLGLHRLQAGVYASNTGSIRALEKAGYALEGKSGRKLRGKDGWEDHLHFGLVNDDWQAGHPDGSCPARLL